MVGESYAQDRYSSRIRSCYIARALSRRFVYSYNMELNLSEIVYPWSIFGNGLNSTDYVLTGLSSVNMGDGIKLNTNRCFAQNIRN